MNKPALSLVRPEPKGRMLKIECNKCGYVVRTTQKWVDAGAPACSCGGDMVLQGGKVLPGPVKALEALPALQESVTPVVKDHLGAVLAAISAGFIPVASYLLAHVESDERPWLWGLVAAALAFSAPTMASWAQRWCDGVVKAWGFTILLEGVMIASDLSWLNRVGLAILLSINAAYAWERARRSREE